jgi:xanthine dehydrogenase/oxidase
MQEVEDKFDATICRCTGYRSILDAMKSFCVDAPTRLKGKLIDIEVLFIIHVIPTPTPPHPSESVCVCVCVCGAITLS